ncbi:carboxymuconolactone decarboxylase family protein [Corynebacterium rouxii]|uniref:Carboxymuconolactone decarboxylase family protein n=1 Tax=Corynebacterium rouxii TaxID=2719119 RepID=A0A6I8MCM5_9CORY|nr:carboxymuconolactone decarboxylase family protein [Corynebacterium rouxii]MDT9407727.1 carboxymuconolactone decarboxylase family protein [Corynebacterium rouxii]MDT9409908.1 carboxymuconolactone decarboxylase family protein [Corynebacterium rouxii]VZH83974.1 hypothetical protein FRC0190_00023 [Corynebacterium rouxii]
MSSAHRPYLDKTHPAAYKALIGVAQEAKKACADAGVGRDLVELVNVRVSQLNGCPMCLSIHVPAARKEGVDEVKLDILPAWRDSKEFSPLERAALGLAEALTSRSAVTGVIDGSGCESAQDAAGEVFNTEQIAALEWAVIVMNSFNRLSIASGHPVLRRS